MDRQAIISVTEGQACNPACRMAAPFSLSLYDGEQIAVVGDNAAGKTRLIETLTGKNPVQGAALRYDFSPSPLAMVWENIKYIAFNDAYGSSVGSNYYLQRRWNSQDVDDDTPTAGELLDQVFDTAEKGAGRYEERAGLRDRLYSLFGLGDLLDKSIITLSSGELRKFHLTRTLLSMPRVLILDNPFIGLDAATRDALSDLLGNLAEKMRILLILVLSRVDVMPSFITHVIPVEGMHVLPKVPVSGYMDHSGAVSDGSGSRIRTILSLPVRDLSKEPFYPVGLSPEIVRCSAVTIRYGDRTILKDFNWTVREGERWALTGENGSGKSTLLSLVCADNPQSYACDIALFGHRRGTGESIWEIKRHIGYVSPEMHRSYQENIPALDIVASGLFDTVGLYRHPAEDQLDICRTWMSIFGIEDLEGRPYLRLSSGEQRLCLLARAFVKDPELLILDEPMHGLDLRHIAMVREIIDSFVKRPHKTLVMVSHYESELPSCIDRRLVLTRQ